MAFLVAVALFAYFWVIGFAVLGLLARQDDLVRNVLIAPALGIVVLLYCAYATSRAGLPIGSDAVPIGLVLLAGAIGALLWRRPLLPGRRGLPYLALLPLALAASGWPLFTDGFAWLGHLNPDAAHYMLDTERLTQHSFLEISDAAVWRNQTDWASTYVLFPLQSVRTGTDLLFAWAVSVTGLDEPTLYMPLILIWHVAALAAAAALIRGRDRFARLLSAGLLAVAALSTYGMTIQLLGQELGLSCFALAAVLLFTPFYCLAWPALLRHTALAALAMAGFILSYPEMLPFCGLSFLLYHVIGVRDVLRHWHRAALSAALIGASALLLIAPDGIGLLSFVFSQAARAGGQMQYATLFPYFLSPSGAAALWGLSGLRAGTGLLPVDVAIVIGGFLSAAAVVASLWLVWRREASAAIVLVMALLAAFLLFGQIGFGTFKLAMYLQPFLMPMMVLALCRVLRVSR